MSEQVTPGPGSLSPQARSRGFWPHSSLGWITIIVTGIALASWLVFPQLTMAYRETYPIVDSWVMPALATTLVDVAAVLNLVTVLFRGERSVLSLATLAVTVLAGLFLTFLVVGEAIAGV
ncbi:MAG: hypothetical protein WBZ24_06860 [Anaerolineales bacterium]